MNFIIKKYIIVVVLLISYQLITICQDSVNQILYLRGLAIDSMFYELSQIKDDNKKLDLNEMITESIQKLFLIEENFEYGFDSLRNMGVILSDDKNVKIFTWNIPLSDGTHLFNGFIQYKSKKTDSILMYSLTDKSAEITDPEFATLSNKNWFGALYYEIVEEKHGKKRYYVLLGYDLNNIFTNKKIIDILYFDDNDLPVFGKPVFDNGKKKKNRIIFEYSAQAAMSLSYNHNLKMIVFDHLSPFELKYQGVYQFYGPDFSYDGLEFDKGIWRLISDVDARN